MTTWTNIKNIANTSGSGGGFKYENDLFYYFDSTGLVEYDPIGDTITTIAAIGDAGITSFADFTVFKTGIYVLAATVSSLQVFKYDGTPHNWTSKESIAFGGGGNLEHEDNLYSNGITMVAVAITLGSNAVPDPATVSRHTTDGETWATSTWSKTPVGAKGRQSQNVYNHIIGTREKRVTWTSENSGSPDWDATEAIVYEFTGVSWNTVHVIADPAADPGADVRIVGVENDTNWDFEPFFDPAQSSNMFRYKRTDLAWTRVTPFTLAEPIYSPNTLESFGHYPTLIAPFTSKLYTWNGSDWVEHSEISAAPGNFTITNQNQAQIFEFTNGNLYLITENVVTTGVEVWEGIVLPVITITPGVCPAYTVAWTGNVLLDYVLEEDTVATFDSPNFTQYFVTGLSMGFSKQGQFFYRVQEDEVG